MSDFYNRRSGAADKMRRNENDNAKHSDFNRCLRSRPRIARSGVTKTVGKNRSLEAVARLARQMGRRGQRRAGRGQGRARIRLRHE